MQAAATAERLASRPGGSNPFGNAGKVGVLNEGETSASRLANVASLRYYMSTNATTTNGLYNNFTTKILPSSVDGNTLGYNNPVLGNWSKKSLTVIYRAAFQEDPPANMTKGQMVHEIKLASRPRGEIDLAAKKRILDAYLKAGMTGAMQGRSNVPTTPRNSNNV